MVTSDLVEWSHKSVDAVVYPATQSPQLGLATTPKSVHPQFCNTITTAWTCHHPQASAPANFSQVPGPHKQGERATATRMGPLLELTHRFSGS